MSTRDTDAHPAPDLTEGAHLPGLTVRLTRADLVAYAGASTDLNPIHWSDRFARAVGMPGVIAHGMLTMATALRAVTDWVGDPAAVRTYSCRFTKPVPVPDTDEGTELRISGRVATVADGVATLALDAVITGEDGADVKVLGNTKVEIDTAALPTTAPSTTALPATAQDQSGREEKVREEQA